MDKNVPRMQEPSMNVMYNDQQPGAVARPRTIFKIGKQGYKENEFGEGVVQSKKLHSNTNPKESEELESRYRGGHKRMHPPVESRQGGLTSPQGTQQSSASRPPRSTVLQSAKVRKSERLKKE